MADEIYIPTNRVPAHILEKLKEIGLLVQSENGLSAPASSDPSSSSSTSSSLPSSNRDNDNDEVDYFQPSAPSSSSSYSAAISDVVSVLNSDVTSYEVAQAQQKNNDDVVSVFASPKSAKDRKPARTAAAADSDVVSLFDSKPSPTLSKDAGAPNQSPRQSQQQQQQQSPCQSTNGQTPSTPQFGSSPSQPVSPQTQSQQQSLFRCQSYPPQTRELGLHQQQQQQLQQQQLYHPHHHNNLNLHHQQQQQQYLSSSFYSEAAGDYFGSLSPGSHYRPSSTQSSSSSSSSSCCSSSLLKKRSSSQGEVLDAVMLGQHLLQQPQHLLRADFHNRSPPVSPAKRARSPSDSESSSSCYAATAATASTAASATFPSPLSSSPHSSSRSRSTPSLPFCSTTTTTGEDDGGGVVRMLQPPRQVTPPPRSPTKSPETPELEGKRVVPEIFTFDDFTCTQERFRMSIERLQQLHEQSTPSAKRAPSTPRKAPSTPPTPSYRRPELHRSTSSFFPPSSSPSGSSRRPSPVDQRLLQCLEAAAAASASSPKKKQQQQQQTTSSTEVPDSPTTASMQSPLQRLSMEEFPQAPSHQRRDSVSPKPKKRLDFEEESHPMLQAQRMRGYDSGGSGVLPPQSAPLASPRASGSGSGCGSENVFTFPAWAGPSGTSASKAALLIEFQKIASLAAYQQEEDEEESGAGDDRMSAFGFAAASGSGSASSRNVYDAVHGGRYATKRRRQEPDVDESGEVAMCTCAVMEQNFLQMAKCAYARIRRLDATDADFDRFRVELAQTNNILRESMGLMEHIREICDHRKRPRW